ncbi:unnamed protein product [Closterium sp. NIES-64]|nr:unnamed protein product [Closterium sp. NIES-64]CAI5981110.1 unnamed protein product [Closterium sp. NIES-65]
MAEAVAKDAAYYESKGIKYSEEFFTNSRGMKLQTASWLPANGEPKALILLLHGYAVDCTTFFASTAERLASEGYAVFGIDYEGHGRSEGLPVYIPLFETIIDDLVDYITPIREREEYKNKRKFMMGESMGGAVTLRLHRKEPTAWDGAILMAPMCKISDKVKPPAIVTAVMKNLAYLLPTWKIVPTSDIISAANRDPVKREKIRASPYTFTDKPRLRTALTMLETSEDLERRLDEVTLPFLLLHGDADTVTEPAVSQVLYEKARSTDKTFKLYPGLWHCLTEGELDENIEIVFKDIFEWLSAHAPQA